jgi:hypothetical protein
MTPLIVYLLVQLVGHLCAVPVVTGEMARIDREEEM